jgi:hypothetical protein
LTFNAREGRVRAFLNVLFYAAVFDPGGVVTPDAFERDIQSLGVAENKALALLKTRSWRC